MPFSYFRPFAIGDLATVLSAGTYATQTWLSTGFQPGIADPASVNTVWRQGAFVFAGITQWMANTLNNDINDDGNLSNFITLFGNAITIGVSGGVTSFNTRTGAVVLTSTDVINALGYTPVRSFNGRTGNVILLASDVNSALGYNPVKKSGDIMGGLLSGPDPILPSQYATKNYVDIAVAAGHTAGNINGNATETNYPLGDGGLIKVGQFFPTNGLADYSYAINFVSAFKTKLVALKVQLVWEPQVETRSDGFGGFITTPPGYGTSIWASIPNTTPNTLETGPNFSGPAPGSPFPIDLTAIQLFIGGFIMDGTDWGLGFTGFGTPPNPLAPAGFVWTAIGF